MRLHLGLLVLLAVLISVMVVPAQAADGWLSAVYYQGVRVDIPAYVQNGTIWLNLPKYAMVMGGQVLWIRTPPNPMAAYRASTGLITAGAALYLNRAYHMTMNMLVPAEKCTWFWDGAELYIWRK